MERRGPACPLERESIALGGCASRERERTDGQESAADDNDDDEPPKHQVKSKGSKGTTNVDYVNPHTACAVVTTNASFARSSFSLTLFPSHTDANPHCGLMPNLHNVSLRCHYYPGPLTAPAQPTVTAPDTLPSAPPPPRSPVS